MKKLLLVLVSLVLVFGLAACKSDDPEVVLNWNIGADPATLDPTLNGASDGGDVINQTFEGLTREIGGIVQPGIAETWEVSADGLTVTFHLRESNWSDGTPLTADDFVYSWLHGMDPATASEYSWIWEYTNVVGAMDFAFGVEGATAADVGIKAIDDLTLEVKLVNRTPYFISLVAFYHFMPVQQAAVESGADGIWSKNPEDYVSNGPFVLTEYELGLGLRLEKNEEYWNADEVMINVIEGKFIDNETTAYAGYYAGEFDVIASVPLAIVPILIAESDEFHVATQLGTYYYSFNMDANGDGEYTDADDDGIWSNLNLRKALSYSIDREAIVEVTGAGEVPAGAFVSPGFKDHDENDFFTEAGSFGIELDDSSYALAVTLFADAAGELGMTVEELQDQITNNEELLYNTSEAHKLVAQMVQEMWAENLGFTIPLLNQDWAVFQGTRKAGDFSVARGGWVTDFMDPSGLLSIFDSANAYNDPNYYNDAYDLLLQEAQEATSLEVHFDKLYEAQVLFMADMPIVPVYHYTNTILVKSYVEGWGRSVLGSVDFSKASIDK